MHGYFARRVENDLDFSMLHVNQFCMCRQSEKNAIAERMKLPSFFNVVS